MFRFLFIFCLGITFLQAQAQDTLKTAFLEEITVRGKKIKLPKLPNMVVLEDSLLIDQTEVSNLHYRLFLEHKKQNPSEYKALLPDTLVWQKFKLNDPYSDHYFRYQGFAQFPLVGVSHEQALAFCVWRSAYLTAYYQNKAGKWKSYDFVFTFRLPTEAEWEKAALAGQNISENPYGFGKKAFKIWKKGVKNPKEAIANWETENGSAETMITNWIYGYEPNDWGIYQMIGNVAEMVKEKGLAKGGSWRDKPENCKINAHQKYEKADYWVGFRCVCEVKITKRK